MPSRPTLVSVLCGAQFVVLIFLSIDLIANSQGKWVLREGGSIETASAVLLAGAALLYATFMGRSRDWHVPVGLILLAMRELDFDKRFTSEGVLQLRLYSGDSPAWEKALGAAIVLLALIVLFRLARYQFMPWLRAFLALAAWAWLFGLSGALIVIAKSLDGIARKLAPLGIEVPDDISNLSSRVEELFELFFALTLIASLTLALRRKDPT